MSSSSGVSATQSATAVTTATATATTTTTTTTTAALDTTTKKKFGKNLNKLTAPPVAPVAQGNNKSNSSSKNGFLLLSTKRTLSGNNAATAKASGGILSSKSAQNTAKPIPNLGLHTEFTSSTHDALLGVVVGASRLESQQQPDAWGVAEKHQQEQEQSQHAPVQNDNEPATVVSSKSVETTPREKNVANDGKVAADASAVEKSEQQQTQEKGLERSNSDSVHAEFRTSNWDEYGGRNLQAKDDNASSELTESNSPKNDDQVAFMKKLARQRAEKKRNEEQNRMLEQKERAAQRLRELEEKMAMKKKETVVTETAKEMKSHDNYSVESQSQSRSRIVLETLKQKDSAATPLSTSPARTQRTLYDPNAPGKSYSSLVAGSPVTKQERSSKNFEQSTKNQQLLVASSKKNGLPSQQGTYSANPESFDRHPVIQLASYDDRDRGDRNTSAAPRMLFDPKSGSMIAVTSRDEGATSGRNRKVGKKSKNSRDKNSKKEIPIDGGNIDSKGRRKLRGVKEVNSANHRLKGVGGEPASTSKQDKKLKIADARKLPRTCGVLYSRDKKGGFFCSDGCEGDLGYGVHSVPGGRFKNAEEYSKYIDCQKQLEEEVNVTYDAIGHDDLMLETGFHISDVKEPKHEWIKPNEKIELITGDLDSPTLQATAREWAPTHTAFALSEREEMALSSTESVDDDEDKEEELGEDDAPLGLGFNPASNMDSVMKSPSIDPSDSLRAVDLTSLSLEPALKGPAKNSHIFAFESGATWGASNPEARTWGASNPEASNDWGAHSGNTYGTGTKNSGSISTSFLSLSTGTTWGTFGTSLNGENANSSGE